MHDTETDRRRVFFRGFSASIFAQVISIALGLISVPISLRYFGPLQYGIWLVIGSVLAYLQLTPFGTTTATSVLLAKEPTAANRRALLQSGVRWLLTVAAALTIATLVSIVFAGTWSNIFGPIPNFIRQEAIAVTVISFVFYALRLPTLVYTSAFVGFQEVQYERLYVALLPVLASFLALVVTVWLAGNLVILAILTGAGQLLCGLAATLHFHLRHRDIMRNRDAPTRPASQLVGSGTRFFLVSVTGMIVWYTDNLVISTFLGPERVTAYGVTFKLFTVGFQVFILATSTLMPMFGDAVAKGHWDWTRDTFNGAISVMAVLGGLVWIGGVVFTWPIISLWTGPSGYGGLLVVLSLGGYGYLLSTVNLSSTFLSSLNATKGMLLGGAAEAGLNLALSLFFLRYFGIGGVALGTLVATLFTTFWVLPRSVAEETEYRIGVEWRFLGLHFVLAVAPGVMVAVALTDSHLGSWIWPLGAVLCALYIGGSWMLLAPTSRQLILTFVPRSIQRRSA